MIAPSRVSVIVSLVPSGSVSEAMSRPFEFSVTERSQFAGLFIVLSTSSENVKVIVSSFSTAELVGLSPVSAVYVGFSVSMINVAVVVPSATWGFSALLSFPPLVLPVMVASTSTPASATLYWNVNMVSPPLHALEASSVSVAAMSASSAALPVENAAVGSASSESMSSEKVVVKVNAGSVLSAMSSFTVPVETTFVRTVGGRPSVDVTPAFVSSELPLSSVKSSSSFV